MWKKVFILVVASIYLSSCKNDTKFFTHNENYPIEYIAEVIPPFYLKVESDTILSNGLRVKIAYNAIKNKTVLKINQENPFKIKKTIYREFETKIQVFNGKEIIFDERITKDYFETNFKNKFWEKAILQSVEIDQIAIQKTKKIVLSFLFYNPQSSNKKSYNLYIDKKGKTHIENTISKV